MRVHFTSTGPTGFSGGIPKVWHGTRRSAACSYQCAVVAFEVQAARGWEDPRSPENLMRLAKQRLRNEGWSNGRDSGARIAIATTIRSAIVVARRAASHELIRRTHSAWFVRALLLDRAGKSLAAR